MNLILPNHLAGLARPKEPPVKMGIYLTLGQLGGTPATTADLVAELVRLKRSEVIRWVAWFSLRLSEPNGLTPTRQCALARELLSDELNAGLEKWLRDGEKWNWALFHRRQMWFLLQMAVVACKEDTPACDDKAMVKAIGRVALMANDVLHAIEPKQEDQDWAADYDRSFVASIIPILDHAGQMEVMARAHAFWFELPQTDKIAERFRQCGGQDFAAAFQAKYGLTLERFYLIALSLYSGFAAHTQRSAAPLLLESDAYLVPHFGRDDVARALAMLSQTPESLTLDLFGRPRQNWAWDVTPLKAKPVVEVFPGKYACPDIDNLYRFLTDGVYFLLQDAYEKGRFGQLFGYVFEEYVNEVIRQFAYDGDQLVRRFYPSPKFVGTNDQVADGILLGDNLLFLMEYKARLLTSREKFAGIPEATWAGIEDILAKDQSRGRKGAFQLAKSIRRLLAAEAIVAGQSEPMTVGTDAQIIPVVVAYEEAVGLGAARRWADGRLRAALTKEGVDPAQVGPLLVLTIHDIELLEALAHKQEWASVLSGYVTYVSNHPTDPMATFGIFSSKAQFRTEDPGSSFLARQFANALAVAESRLPDHE